MKAQRVVDVARTFVGLPYRHQGHTTHGLDCWGLVRLTCETLEIVPPDFKPSESYGRLSNGPLVASVAKYCKELSEPELACLMLMRFPAERNPSHMALMTSFQQRWYMIHAHSTAGKVVEHGYSHPWTLFKHSFWRLPAVEQ